MLYNRVWTGMLGQNFWQLGLDDAIITVSKTFGGQNTLTPINWRNLYAQS